MKDHTPIVIVMAIIMSLMLANRQPKPSRGGPPGPTEPYLAESYLVVIDEASKTTTVHRQ